MKEIAVLEMEVPKSCAVCNLIKTSIPQRKMDGAMWTVDYCPLIEELVTQYNEERAPFCPLKIADVGDTFITAHWGLVQVPTVANDLQMKEGEAIE